MLYDKKNHRKSSPFLSLSSLSIRQTNRMQFAAMWKTTTTIIIIFIYYVTKNSTPILRFPRHQWLRSFGAIAEYTYLCEIIQCSRIRQTKKTMNKNFLKNERHIKLYTLVWLGRCRRLERK